MCTNRTIGTNGRVEWTSTQTGALKYILSLYNGKSISTNRTIGRVEWTTTQTVAHKYILSLYNDVHFTNGTPIDKV